MTPQMLEFLRVGIVGLQDWAWDIIQNTPQGEIHHIAKLINCRCNQFIEIFDEMKTPKTNADRIRSMADEELAEFLQDIPYFTHDALMVWLREEAK